jgi:hypothetical protein
VIRAVEKIGVHLGVIRRVLAAAFEVAPGLPAPRTPNVLAIHVEAGDWPGHTIAVNIDRPEQVDDLVEDIRKAQAIVWPWHKPEDR